MSEIEKDIVTVDTPILTPGASVPPPPRSAEKTLGTAHSQNVTVALGPPPLVKPPQKKLAFLGKGSVDESRRRRFTPCSPSPWLILTPLVERH